MTVGDVKVFLDTRSSERYGALGPIIYGGCTTHTRKLKAYWLLQLNGDYTHCTDKFRGDHHSLASTV